LHRNKLLAIAMMVIMTMGLLGGCSPAEKGFYGLMTEINSQKVYTDSGSVKIALTQLPASAVAQGEGAFDQAVLMRALNQHRIDYTGKADLSKNLLQYNFNIVDTATNSSYPVLTLVAKDEMFYCKIDGLIDYLGMFTSPAEKQELENSLGDVVWISLSNDELNAMLVPGAPPVFSGDIFRKSSTQQAVWQRLVDGLVNDAYKDYQSSLVTQNSTGYTLTLRGADLVSVIKPAAIYTVNHIDDLGAVLNSFLNGLSGEEMATLGLTAEARNEMKQSVATMVQDVNQNRAEYLGELENLSPMASQEIMATLNDSQLTTTLGKIDATTYRQDTQMHVHISSGYPVETMEFTISQEHRMKTGGVVQVSAPAAQVITYTELAKRMPDRMEINVDSGAYHGNRGFMSSSGTMEVHLANNYTYLPLRLIGESLGEEIGWDQASFQAYALQNGQRIYMTSLYFNNRAFIKIRDFERLGYTVVWDAGSRTAAISR